MCQDFAFGDGGMAALAQTSNEVSRAEIVRLLQRSVPFDLLRIWMEYSLR